MIASLDTQDNRIRLIGVFLVFIALLFVWRLFSLQIISGAKYKNQAIAGQTTSLTIPAERGRILAYNNETSVPLVFNDTRWTIFSDGEFVEGDEGMRAVREALYKYGISISQENELSIRNKNRYVIIRKSISDAEKQAIESEAVKGIYFQPDPTRGYSEGSLAAQTIGFVNNENSGQYGLEQQFNEQLTGIDGQLKAVTDANGTPLAFEKSNIAEAAKNGQDIQLTLDVGVQQIAESALEQAIKDTKAERGSVVVLSAKDGSVRSIANYPTFSPASYNQVQDQDIYTNHAISTAIEPGSVMKPLVMATALDKNVVEVDGRYNDPFEIIVDGSSISNALNYGAAERGIDEILPKSLNTGSTYLLKQLGGGDFNLQGRQTLYDYFTNIFGLGSKTGIKLPNEATGQVFSPEEGYALNLRFANMTFGQGLTVTPLQLAAAYGSLLNEGIYYQPRIVERVGETEYSSVTRVSQTLDQETISELAILFDRMADDNYSADQVDGLRISGKTGTAEIANPDGGYLTDAFMGTFVGYIESANETLIIAVKVERPENVRFAGSGAAKPVWAKIVNDLVSTGALE